MGRLAAEHGLHLRAHVEQFATHRSVPVALAAGARSVDHLACLHPDDVAPLAAAECAAVLLPGAELMGAEEVAPGRALADAGAICVLATDCNPGTSPLQSLPLIAGLAVRRYGWSARLPGSSEPSSSDSPSTHAGFSVAASSASRTLQP